MDTAESVLQEYAPPNPIEYVSPTPYCVCPDLGEENLVKITDTAFKILKGDIKLTQELEKQVRTDRAKRGSHKVGTMEGGEDEKWHSSRTVRSKSVNPLEIKRVK